MEAEETASESESEEEEEEASAAGACGAESEAPPTACGAGGNARRLGEEGLAGLSEGAAAAPRGSGKEPKRNSISGR